MEITSRENRVIKDFRRLSEDAHFRRDTGRFTVEGARLCADAVRSGVAVEAVLVTARAREQYPDAVAAVCAVAAAVYDIPETLSRYVADTATPQGVFCVAAFPPPRTLDELRQTGRYAALEAVRDPGNLGTMIRTAEAFGLDGLLLSDGCCDPYSPKVLRGSMGGVFRLPLYAAGDLAHSLPRLTAQGFTPTACVVDANATAVQTAALGKGTVAVIGNEGHGLRAETIAACPLRVTIPMAGRAESLNASIAAGLVFWEMVRKDGVPRG